MTARKGRSDRRSRVGFAYGSYGFRRPQKSVRILAAALAAGIHQIDYLVITHYHQDHAGGVPQLAARIPIVNFIDHGPNFEDVKDNGEVYSSYVARSKGKYLLVRPGDAIPIHGIQVVVVAASFTVTNSRNHAEDLQQ